MDFHTTKINTVERAKQYFKAMGCNYFHMCREYPDRYNEYLKLALPKKLEREWTNAEIAQASVKLNNLETNPNDLWRIHSDMENLVQQRKTKAALRVIYEATKIVATRLPKRTKVIVAETIVGRSQIRYRSGLIFLAYDLNEITISRHLSEIAIDLSSSTRGSCTEPKRCQRALDNCAAIRRILEFR
jgi:hypothetical protein